MPTVYRKHYTALLMRLRALLTSLTSVLLVSWPFRVSNVFVCAILKSPTPFHYCMCMSVCIIFALETLICMRVVEMWQKHATAARRCSTPHMHIQAFLSTLASAYAIVYWCADVLVC